MMKRGLWILVFLCVSSAYSLSEAQIIDTSSELVLEHSLSNEMTISYGSRSAQLTTLKVDVPFIPQESYRQEVRNTIFTPEPNTKDTQNAQFLWKNPKEGKVPFSMTTTIATHNKLMEVNKKITFPLGNIPLDAQAYLGTSEYVDINDKITRQANIIAAGNDDLFYVVNEVAFWIEQNIEYSLNTVTADAALPASWVLENRQGVCDEITLLFIAMLRSLGIPARYVSGMAYTPSDLFEIPWNAHAWAEVYFPETGWIPFDIAYRQFGWIDASHIKLIDDAEAKASTTHYEWNGYDLSNVNVDIGELMFSTKILSYSGKYTSPVNVKARIVEPYVGFGSYNELEVTIVNPTSSYVSVPLNIYTTADIVLVKNVTHNAIEPYGTLSLHYPFSVSKKLKNNLRYTIPFHIVTPFDNTTIVKLSTDADGPLFAESLFNYEVPQELIHNVEIVCIEQYTWINQMGSISCSLINKGTVYYDALQVCLEDSCMTTSLLIAGEEEINLQYYGKQVGVHHVSATISDGKVTMSKPIAIYVEDKPSVKVVELPEQVIINYGETLDMELLLNVSGRAIDAHAQLSSPHTSIRWELGDMKYAQKLVGSLDSTAFSSGDNEMNLVITYKDKDGISYTTQDQFIVNMQKVSIFNRIWLSIIHLFQRLD